MLRVVVGAGGKVYFNPDVLRSRRLRRCSSPAKIACASPLPAPRRRRRLLRRLAARPSRPLRAHATSAAARRSRASTSSIRSARSRSPAAIAASNTSPIRTSTSRRPQATAYAVARLNFGANDEHELDVAATYHLERRYFNGVVAALRTRQRAARARHAALRYDQPIQIAASSPAPTSAPTGSTKPARAHLRRRAARRRRLRAAAQPVEQLRPVAAAPRRDRSSSPTACRGASTRPSRRSSTCRPTSIRCCSISVVNRRRSSPSKTRTATTSSSTSSARSATPASPSTRATRSTPTSSTPSPVSFLRQVVYLGLTYRVGAR